MPMSGRWFFRETKPEKKLLLIISDIFGNGNKNLHEARDLFLLQTNRIIFPRRVNAST